MEETPSTDSLKVEVAFDHYERQAAEWAARNRGPLLLRPVVLVPVATVGVVLAAWAGWVWARGGHPGQSSLAGTLLLGVLTTGLLIYTVRASVRRSEENERHEQNPDVYTLDDAGLEISAVDDLTLLLWSSMTRVHETKRFFLFVAGWEVQYLPKRALEPAQVEFVRTLIRRHAPASGRALPADTAPG